MNPITPWITLPLITLTLFSSLTRPAWGIAQTGGNRSGEPIYRRQAINRERDYPHRYLLPLKPFNFNAGLTLAKFPTSPSYSPTLRPTLRNNPRTTDPPDQIIRAKAVPNDPYYPHQWALSTIQVETAWELVPVAKRANITIAILDTGINQTHEDLAENLVPGYDFVNNDPEPEDHQGHGTHVAAIAAGLSNNGKGISGVAAGSKIMPVKVLGDTGNGSFRSISNGIRFAVDHGADVINLSLGSDEGNSIMEEALDYALQKGVSVIAASGNEDGPVLYPAAHDGVIAVGATNETDQRAEFSNHGPELDIVAPGTNITSAYIQSPTSYTAMSGTSMAAPLVSGVVALIRAANPILAPPTISNILRRSATDLGPRGYDQDYGYGLANATRAVQMALNNFFPGTPAIPASNAKSISRPASSNLLTQPLSNLALNKAVAASSSLDSTDIQSGNDGNTATRWASNTSTEPQWFTIDLGKIATIHKLVLKWDKAYAKSYQIQLSNEGLHWTTVYDTTTGTGEITTLTGDIRGRYLRLFATEAGTSNGYAFWEFEVYGL